MVYSVVNLLHGPL